MPLCLPSNRKPQKLVMAKVNNANANLDVDRMLPPSRDGRPMLSGSHCSMYEHELSVGQQHILKLHRIVEGIDICYTKVTPTMEPIGTSRCETSKTRPLADCLKGWRASRVHNTACLGFKSCLHAWVPAAACSPEESSLIFMPLSPVERELMVTKCERLKNFTEEWKSSITDAYLLTNCMSSPLASHDVSR